MDIVYRHIEFVTIVTSLLSIVTLLLSVVASMLSHVHHRIARPLGPLYVSDVSEDDKLLTAVPESLKLEPLTSKLSKVETSTKALKQSNPCLSKTVVLSPDELLTVS